MGITGINEYCNNQINAYRRAETKGEAGTGKSGMEEEILTREEMFSLISKRMTEIYEKVKNNDTEPSFQIGGQSFTVKEWDRFLEQFDVAQDELRKQMQEEQAKRQNEKTTKVMTKPPASVTSKDSTDIAKAAGVSVFVGDVASNGVETEGKENTLTDSLVAESTICTYPASGDKDSDEMYITWYTEEGIFCRKQGQSEGYLWHIVFEHSAQYNEVMNFLKGISKDADYRFAAREEFWQDFLKGEVDCAKLPV